MDIKTINTKTSQQQLKLGQSSEIAVNSLLRSAHGITLLTTSRYYKQLND